MDRNLMVVLLLVGVALAGCTDAPDDGDGGDGAPTGGQNNGTNNTTEPDNVTVDVALTGAYPATIAYDPAEIRVAGESIVTIRFTNSDAVPTFNHDWVLEGYEENASTEIIANGETDEVTFDAPPVGSYKFYCSVQGHRDNGMEGDFIVE